MTELCQGTGDTCGWAAALISTLAFGSFAVPIKSPTCVQLQIDPMVFQTYKTFMCLITSFALILLLDPPHKNDPTYTNPNLVFSPWGIVSGLFWVPGGVAAVYAVQNAGLAVSQGVWSSLIVLVSFTWGFGVFDEKVYSVSYTLLAIFLMIAGLWGMSFFSSPSTATKVGNSNTNAMTQDRSEKESASLELGERILHPDINYEENDKEKIHVDISDTPVSSVHSDDTINSGESTNSHEMEYMIKDDMPIQTKKSIFSSRVRGLLSATFTGLYGGSLMVPMHYAPGSGGLHFVISFAIGATIVTILLWICRFFHNFLYISQLAVHPQNPNQNRYYFQKNLYKCKVAYQQLPSFHIRQMILPGGTAGFIWSIGNIGSMISVAALGEGIGYSVVQASMLVSGLWGILWFKEIQDKCSIAKWFVAAMTTVVGIILLSYQHVNESSF